MIREGNSGNREKLGGKTDGFGRKKSGKNNNLLEKVSDSLDGEHSASVTVGKKKRRYYWSP